MPADPIDCLVDRCLVHALSPAGHSLYLAHPDTHETITLTACADRDEVERLERRFRRVLLGIIHAALEREQRQPDPEDRAA